MRTRRTKPSATQLSTGVARGCGTVFFGVFAVFGLIVTGVLIWEFKDGVATYAWDETPCTIVESHRIEPGVERSETSDTFVIRYRYTAKGAKRTSGVLSRGPATSRDASDIERLLAEYPQNSATRCFVNPGNPEEAVLRRPSLWPALFVLIPLIFVAIGVGGIINVWRAPRPAAKSVVHKVASGRAGKTVGTVFGIVFSLVGAGLIYGLTIHPALRVSQARSWDAVPCKILTSDVGRHRGNKGGTTYSVDITYQYTLNGREYRSDRYQFMGGSSSGRSGKAKIVKEHPTGATKTCYVNPKDPTDAVLNRRFTPIMLIGLFGLIFLAIGLGVILGANRKAAGAAKSSATPALPSLHSPGSPLVSGPVELESAASPVAKFIGVFVIAAFWNGITSVFVVQAVQSWLRKKPEFLLTLFMTPFVLVGIGLLFFLGTMFLNLFNPRIRLSASSGAVPLGGRLDARWSFRGRSRRIRQLRISVEGMEKAQYRRGTSNATDTRIFARLPLVDTTDAHQIAGGNAQIQIPASLMHSFAAQNNEIVWKIKVHGDVPRFPDVDDEFPITILPRG